MRQPVIIIVSVLCALLVLLQFNSYADKPESLSELVQRLSSPVPKIAGDAAFKLLKIAPHINPSVVRLACETAARVKEQNTHEWMTKVILKSSIDPTTRSLCALGAGLLTIIKNENGKPKAQIPSELVNALIDSLRKDDPYQVRIASARALGYTYSRKAICPLFDIVQDTSEDPIVQTVAADSLTKIMNFIVNLRGESIKKECSPGPDIPESGSFVTQEMLIKANLYIMDKFVNFIKKAMPQ